MRSRNFSFILHKLKVSTSLRCPECEIGCLFERSYHMKTTCDYCKSRFQRWPGESIGAVYITTALAGITALSGVFLAHHMFDVPVVHQVPFWVLYIVGFVAASYRYTRGLWTGIEYLTGGIYPDQDYEYGEYVRVPLKRRTRIQHENDRL